MGSIGDVGRECGIVKSVAVGLVGSPLRVKMTKVHRE